MSMANLVERAEGFDGSLRNRILADLAQSPAKGCVGQKLVVDERIRVWMIPLPAGGQKPLHNHVKDYLWLALKGRRARSCIISDESARWDELKILPGARKLTRGAAGAFKSRDLENAGGVRLHEGFRRRNCLDVFQMKGQTVVAEYAHENW
jgi:hypothetical protein